MHQFRPVTGLDLHYDVLRMMSYSHFLFTSFDPPSHPDTGIILSFKVDIGVFFPCCVGVGSIKLANSDTRRCHFCTCNS